MSLSWMRRLPGVREAGIRLLRLWSVLRRRELFPPGHYYSPVPDLGWIERRRDELFATEVDLGPGIDLREREQQDLLAELAVFADDFDVPPQPLSGRRYHTSNVFFGRGSAFNLYAMLRRFRPARVIEIGSGFSSALMLDVNEREFGGAMSLTFVEPNPQRLQSLLRKDDERCTCLIERPVQAVPLDLFDDLQANDVLFVDSSHVTKIGSDVNHLLFNVLPRLKPGVLVHFHDVTWPFEYPERWLREGRFWNEAYLLRAFLQFNSAYEIVLFDDFLLQRRGAFFRRMLPGFADGLGCSLWLRRV